jgi:hypothetical protein
MGARIRVEGIASEVRFEYDGKLPDVGLGNEVT